LSLQYLDVIRSTTASFYRTVHSHKLSKNNHVVAHHFFKARRQTINKLPSRYPEFFNVGSILSFVSNWARYISIDIRPTAKETLVPLIIVIIWRSSSDLGNL
ncbi:hypothetical protein BCV72DRAFT_218294, partial [Rhizopus microsporus var. microsporus]